MTLTGSFPSPSSQVQQTQPMKKILPTIVVFALLYAINFGFVPSSYPKIGFGEMAIVALLWTIRTTIGLAICIYGGKLLLDRQARKLVAK
jgi:hypothetical protein